MIGFIADPHVGNFKANGGPMVDGLNDRGRMSLEAFRQAVKKACELGVDLLCVAGDLFHTRRPEPAVISGVLEVLVNDARNLPVLIIPGNHDMLDSLAENGNTACQPLYREASVVNSPSWIPAGEDREIFAVPFQSQEPMDDYLQHLLPLQAAHDEVEKKILLTHVGVYDNDSPPWCGSAKDAIHKDELFEAMKAGGFDLAVVGNYHNGRTWENDDGQQIVQCGTLCPHGHSDAGFFPSVGGLWVLGDDGMDAHEIPGPRFYDTAEGRVMGKVEIDESEQDPVPTLHKIAVEPMTTVEDRVLASELPQAGGAHDAIMTFIDKAFDPVDGHAESLKRAVKTEAIALWEQA